MSPPAGLSGSMVKWFVGAAAVVAVGAAAQRIAERRDERAFPAPGRHVSVGDADVHVIVEGSGPVVLIDSGLGGSSLEWDATAADLARDFTVVRYDRPGYAWSAASQCDRRALAAANRIVRLLDALALPGPAILVGHSLGAIHVRLAAALAPARVSGLVLVDPSHEDMLGAVDTTKTVAATSMVMRAVARAAPLGVGRLAGRVFAPLTMAECRQPLDPDQLQSARVSGLLTSRTAHGLHALAAEQTALVESLQQVRSVIAAHPEPDVPFTVITAAAPFDKARMIAARAAIDALHAQLVAGRPHGRQVFAERSGHLVPFDQPEIIARCVRETAPAIAVGTRP